MYPYIIFGKFGRLQLVQAYKFTSEWTHSPINLSLKSLPRSCILCLLVEAKSYLLKYNCSSVCIQIVVANVASKISYTFYS